MINKTYHITWYITNSQKIIDISTIIIIRTNVQSHSILEAKGNLEYIQSIPLTD